MRHRKKNIKLKHSSAYRNALLKNLATSVILYEKVKTTRKKAKAVAQVVETLIHIAKKSEKGGSKMNSIRQLNQMVFDENAAKKLIDELIKRYKEKEGGYTRVINLGYRRGDAAPMVMIELT